MKGSFSANNFWGVEVAEDKLAVTPVIVFSQSVDFLGGQGLLLQVEITGCDWVLL